MIDNHQMDDMLNDIVDIFTNIEGVQLVRISGLIRRASRISGKTIDIETINMILNKMKANNIINWKYIYQCPFCKEIFYQIDDTPSDKPKLCDTCNTMFVPQQNLYNSLIIF